MTLKDARRLAGLTQAQLAAAAGLRLTTISDLELGRNRRPAHEIVVKVVRALQRNGLAGVTTDDLFPVPDDPSSAPTTQAVA